MNRNTCPFPQPLCGNFDFSGRPVPECLSASGPAVVSSSACQDGMERVLKLLGEPSIARYIDFQKFAFLTPFSLAGSRFLAPDSSSGASCSNLGPLQGRFCRLTGDGLLEISAAAAWPFPQQAGSPAEPSPLPEAACVCAGQLTAVAFASAGSASCGAQAAFERVREYLQAHARTRLPVDGQTGRGSAIGRRLTAGAGRTAAFMAHGLVLSGVSVLGVIDGILILAGEEDRRFYLVRAGCVQFAGL